MTLEELNSNRDNFIKEVEVILASDLKENGFMLESVTISKLDQTDEQFLKDGNIFDAQGKRKIAEITQHNQTERNLLVRTNEEARKKQDVDTQKSVLTLEQDEADATARQQAEIAKIQASTKKEAEQKEIEARREVELAEVEKQKKLEVAAQDKQQAVGIGRS
jgi:flotillin